MQDTLLSQVETLWAEFQQRKLHDPTYDLRQFADDCPDATPEAVGLLPLIDGLKDLRLAEPEPPEQIGRYSVVRRVGVGGMGTVYEAVSQDALREQVALKVLEFPNHEVSKRRFEREAHVAASLHHSNIVPIYDFGCSEEHYYYTMRLIDGPDLSQVLHEDWSDGELGLSRHERVAKKVAQRLACNWQMQASLFREVATAIAYAHDQGVLHRDIKPANLIIDLDEKVWVSDFGLAKPSNDPQHITWRSRALGTPRYMPPEQIRGESTEQSDIFSLGIVMYEMAILRTDGRNSRHEIWSGGMQRPRKLNPAIPEAYENIILKCVALDPKDRFKNAYELVAAISRFSGAQKNLDHSWLAKSNARPAWIAISAATVSLAASTALFAWNPETDTTHPGRGIPAALTSALSSVANLPPRLAGSATGVEPMSIQLPESAARRPIALEFVDDETSATDRLFVSAVTGKDRRDWVLTPTGVLLMNPESRSSRQPHREYSLSIGVSDRTTARFAHLATLDGQTSLVVESVGSDCQLNEVDRLVSPFHHGTIDFASADGRVFYHIQLNGSGSTALHRSELNPDRSWTSLLLNENCGLSRSTSALATEDGRRFVSLETSKGGEVVLHDLILEANGAFRVMKSNRCSIDSKVAGLSWLDDRRFQHMRVLTGGHGFCFTYERDDEFFHLPLASSGPTWPGKTNGLAAWIEQSPGAERTDQNVVLRFRSASAHEESAE